MRKLPKLVPVTVEKYSAKKLPPAFAPGELPQVAIKMSVVGGECKFALVMEGQEVFAARMKRKRKKS